MARARNDGQLDLLCLAIEDAPSAPAVDRRAPLVEQIRRDMAVLQEDERYWDPPGREFYERRIESCREELRTAAAGPGAAR
jgi:hypothetical protein